MSVQKREREKTLQTTEISPAFRPTLACPLCKEAFIDPNWVCRKCQRQWPLGPSGQPDLRLQEPLVQTVPLTYNPQLCQIPESLWELPESVQAKMKEAKSIKGRGETDLKAWLKTLIQPGMRVLDLGARSNRDQKLVESMGAHYLAVEIAAADAMILGDAHALPLVDNCIDIVMTMSVFEHLKQPFLAAQEVKRVLKPQGHFVGMVGFLEPVHGLPHGSFYHHSYLGMFNLLESTGLKTQYLATSHGWTAIHAISRTMLPGFPKRLVYAIIAPLRWLHQFLWFLVGLKNGDRPATRKRRNRVLSASVHFVAVKPEPS